MTTIEVKNEAAFLAHNQKIQKEMFEKMCQNILANYNKLSGENLTYEFGKYDSRSKQQAALTALFDKLNHMTFNLYSPQSIPGFLTRIATKPVKVISKPEYKDEPEVYGTGHFRWDWKAYTLNENELQALRIYLGLHIKENAKRLPVTAQSVPKPDFEVITDYHNQADAFLLWTGAEFETEFKEHSTYFDGDKETRDIYTVTLKNSRHRYRFTFGQSISNIGKHPTAYDVLASLTKYDPYTFSDFCSSYGYEEDSRAAYKTYKAVMKEYHNLAKLFTPEQMELLQEIN